MLSNVIFSTYLQYADYTDRATLPIGVKGRKRKEKKRVVPRAAAAYGRQLKKAQHLRKLCIQFALYTA